MKCNACGSFISPAWEACLVCAAETGGVIVEALMAEPDSPNEQTCVKNEFNEKRSIHLDEAARLYRERGWVKIWSGHLNCPLYLVRNRRVKVPNPAILQYTEKEVRTLKGLTLAAIITLHEAKVLFNGAVSEGENGED